jgi:ABC-type molybdate transport system substrate-binding protein
VHGKATDRKIDGVEIAAPLNQQHKVGYAIGALDNGRNGDNANRFLAYLGTQKAQDIYASYGFVPATSEELKLKPIPAKK